MFKSMFCLFVFCVFFFKILAETDINLKNDILHCESMWIKKGLHQLKLFN